MDKEHEDEIRDAFKQTMAVRTKGADARALAAGDHLLRAPSDGNANALRVGVFGLADTRTSRDALSL